MRFIVFHGFGGSLGVVRCTPENLRRLARAALRADAGRLTPDERAELAREVREREDISGVVRRLLCGPTRGFGVDICEPLDHYRDHFPG